MKEVIDALINTLHRKGVISDVELLNYNIASSRDDGKINPPMNVISALNQMGRKEDNV